MAIAAEAAFAQRETPVGRVFKVHGAVYVTRVGDSRKHALAKGDALYAGDVVQCKSGADVVLKIGGEFAHPADCTIPYPIPAVSPNGENVRQFSEGARVGFATAPPATIPCGSANAAEAVFAGDVTEPIRMEKMDFNTCACPDRADAGGTVCIYNESSKTISYVYVARLARDGRTVKISQLLDLYQEIAPHETAFYNFHAPGECLAVVEAIFEDGARVKRRYNLCAQTGSEVELDIEYPTP